jgi:hypothetical protein
MEPRNDESQKPPQPRQEEKQPKRRFQIVKLEERVAPGHNGSYFFCRYPGGSQGAGNGCLK